jgi:hypothetical protein
MNRTHPLSGRNPRRGAEKRAPSVIHIGWGSGFCNNDTATGNRSRGPATAAPFFDIDLIADARSSGLLSGSPDQIVLVPMGDNGIRRTDADGLCAIHLRNRLEGRPGDPDAVRRLVLAGGEVGRFHDPARPFLHPEDVDIALDIDRYDFAVRVNFENGRPVARIETPAAMMPKLPA